MSPSKARHPAWTVKGKRVTEYRDRDGQLVLHVSKNGRAVQDSVVAAVARVLFPQVEWGEPRASSIRSLNPVPPETRATKEKG